MGTKPNLAVSATDSTYRFGIAAGISAGAIALLGGIALCMIGITGATEFVFQSSGSTIRIVTGTVGIIIAALGVMTLRHFKPKITTVTKQETKSEEWASEGNTVRKSTVTTTETHYRSECRENKPRY